MCRFSPALSSAASVGVHIPLVPVNFLLCTQTPPPQHQPGSAQGLFLLKVAFPDAAACWVSRNGRSMNKDEYVSSCILTSDPSGGSRRPRVRRANGPSSALF